MNEKLQTDILVRRPTVSRDLFSSRMSEGLTTSTHFSLAPPPMSSNHNHNNNIHRHPLAVPRSLSPPPSLSLSIASHSCFSVLYTVRYRRICLRTHESEKREIFFSSCVAVSRREWIVFSSQCLFFVPSPSDENGRTEETFSVKAHTRRTQQQQLMEPSLFV